MFLRGADDPPGYRAAPNTGPNVTRPSASGMGMTSCPCPQVSARQSCYPTCLRCSTRKPLNRTGVSRPQEATRQLGLSLETED